METSEASWHGHFSTENFIRKMESQLVTAQTNALRTD